MTGPDVARVLAAIMLVCAIRDQPYTYYTLLRWVVSSVAAYTAVQAFRGKIVGVAWLFGTIAGLFNPLLPVHLGKSLWLPIDIASALLILASIPVVRASQKGSRQVDVL